VSPSFAIVEDKMKEKNIKLHAYTQDVQPGVTMHATLTLWDHEDDSGDFTEAAREAFRTTMANVWESNADTIKVYTEEEQESYFLRGD